LILLAFILADCPFSVYLLEQQWNSLWNSLVDG
jgi:hypothetical protein